MKKNSITNLFRHSAVYAIATYLQRFLSFLMMPFYTRTEYFRSLEAFGDYILLYTFIAFTNFLFVMGQDVAFLRFLHKDKANERDIFAGALVNTLVSSSVFAGLIIVFRVPLAHWLGISRPEFFIWAVIIILLDTLTNPYYTILRAREQSVQFSFIKILRFFLELLFNILFVVVFRAGILGVLYANALAALINLIILMFAARLTPGRYQWPLAARMLRFGLPFVPTGVAFVAIEQIDKFMVNKWLGKEEVSIYGASYKFGTILLFLVIAFRNAWQPYFLRVAKEMKDSGEIFARVILLVTTGMTVLWMMLALFLGDFLTLPIPGIGPILGEPQYWEGVKVIPIILLSYVYYAMYIGFTPGFYILEKGGYLTLFTFVGMVTNILVNWFFLPTGGYMVAAWATLAAYFSMAMMILAFSKKIYPLPVSYTILGGLMVGHFALLAMLQILQPAILQKMLIFFIFMTYIFVLEHKWLKNSFFSFKKVLGRAFHE